MAARILEVEASATVVVVDLTLIVEPRIHPELLSACLDTTEDFIELNLSPLGWPHTAACLVAMGAFFPLMFIRKGGAKHRAWGRVYAIAYAVACVTGLCIYRLHKFFFPHWLAIGGLLVLGAGYLAARYKPRGWRVMASARARRM